MKLMLHTLSALDRSRSTCPTANCPHADQVDFSIGNPCRCEMPLPDDDFCEDGSLAEHEKAEASTG